LSDTDDDAIGNGAEMLTRGVVGKLLLGDRQAERLAEDRLAQA
jgi:hypothetical protein